MLATSEEEDMPIMQTAVSPFTIDFRSVSFQYSKKRGRVLRDLDLRVESGEYLGIIGSSGSGKSTILKLLLGLYLPTNG